jgi:hypothetical protein
LLTGKKTTTDKESYIISDPNLDKLKPGTEYRPQIGVKTVGRDLGHYTVQHFSGEWSHKQRAETLKRRQILHTAVIEALKKANEEALVVESDFKVDKFFDYLLGR